MSADMFAPEAEAMLSALEARGEKSLGPALAAILRKLRDRIADPEQQAKTAAWRARNEQEELEELSSHMVELGMPRRAIEQVQSSDLSWSDPMQRLDRAISSGLRMVILAGPPGTGKTVTACRFMWDYRRGRFCKAVSYAGIAQNEEWKRQIYQVTSILVIDDLGFDPDFAAWRINELLAARYDGPKHWLTIATTNLSRPELERRYSRPIIDRVAEDGGVLWCEEVLRKSFKDRIGDAQRSLIPDEEQP